MTNVTLYTKAFCSYCSRAKQLLNDKGVAFEEHDVTMGGPKRIEMLERANGRTSVPQIFIGDRHIGGCDDLIALERSGQLDPMLA